MTSNGKRTGTVGYNVQVAVDTKHHLIVEHDVTNIGDDKTKLEWPHASEEVSLQIGDSLVSISKPDHYVESIEILTEPERRRRRKAQEIIAILQQTLEPRASVSPVAHRHGVSTNQVFGWRKQ